MTRVELAFTSVSSVTSNKPHPQDNSFRPISLLIHLCKCFKRNSLFSLFYHYYLRKNKHRFVRLPLLSDFVCWNRLEAMLREPIEIAGSTYPIPQSSNTAASKRGSDSQTANPAWLGLLAAVNGGELRQTAIGLQKLRQTWVSPSWGEQFLLFGSRRQAENDQVANKFLLSPHSSAFTSSLSCYCCWPLGLSSLTMH